MSTELPRTFFFLLRTIVGIVQGSNCQGFTIGVVVVAEHQFDLTQNVIRSIHIAYDVFVTIKTHSIHISY